MGVLQICDMENITQLQIKSYRGSYEVRFVGDIASTLSSELTSNDRIIVDANVVRLHDTRVGGALALCDHRIIEPNENEKSYISIGDTIDWLIHSGFKRSGRIVAIGGGILQDISAFAASILYRGVDWIFVPTNLLSQCDSCIGSKTSVNFGQFKNQLGGFHPAKKIFIDKTFLTTLGEGEIRSGLGEMLHYFLIDGRESFELMRSSFDKALNDFDVIQQLMGVSLKIKKRMIEIDEFDQGPRNIFNYGHSFGHALESYTSYEIPHGIAISYGMDMANRLSWKLGLLSKEAFLEMRSLLSKNWVRFPHGPIDFAEYTSLMCKDKKNVDKDLRLILTRGLGDMFVQKVPADEAFLENLEACFNHYQQQ
jgi:3-dehydroquinate synthase